MINAFQELTSYEGTSWDDFLDRISLIHIFEPVLKRYPDNGVRKALVQYIVRCYSLDSPDIVIGMEWGKNKKIIFEKLMLPPLMYHELVLFDNIYEDAKDSEFDLDEKHEKRKDIDAIRKTITMWLNFQDSEKFVQLSVLRELKQEMQASAISPIVKSSGEIDYDQKFKNAKYVIELRSMIEETEQELIQNNPILKVAVKEVKEKKVKTSFGVESFISRNE